MMTISFDSRRELLAGYNGQFRRGGLIDRAITQGNLREAVWFARQLVMEDPLSAAECAEHDTALEFLGDFDPVGGIDEYIAQVTDNEFPVGVYARMSDEAFMHGVQALLNLSAA